MEPSKAEPAAPKRSLQELDGIRHDEGVFERFTERARQVVVLAQEESQALGHDYIGTEHILLGLLCEEEGLAARVLESLDVTLEVARDALARIVPPGEETVVARSIPFTPRAKGVLELALHEALSLGHDYIGTEHILLGLVSEHKGVAARILDDLDAHAEKIRNEVIRMLSGPGGRHRGEGQDTQGDPHSIGPSRPALATRGLSDALLDGAGPPLGTLTHEIDERLGRTADAGDLLVLLACVPDGLAARTLASLGVDAEKLARAAEKARSAEVRSQLLPASALLAECENLRAEKDAALAVQELERAANLRDRERKLLEQALGDAERGQQELLSQVRRHLGLAGD